MPPSSLRRAFLRAFLGFLGVIASIAIAVVVGGEFNDTMARVLGTTGSVSAGSVLAMACAAFRERQQLAGALGVGLAALATAMLVALLWQDRVDVHFGRATLLAITLAVAVAHAELMLLGHLPARHRWVQRALVGLIGLMAALVSLLIYDHFTDVEAMARFVGVVAILIALGTLAVPILLWLSRSERAAAESVAPVAAGGCDAPARLLLQRQPDGSWRGDDGAVYDLRRRG